MKQEIEVFQVGDKVHNMSLVPCTTSVTGGFPWNRESIATIIEFHPYGTNWVQIENTGPMTYMIRYELTDWMRTLPESSRKMWEDNKYPIQASRLTHVVV